MSYQRLPGIKQGVDFSFYADYSVGGVAETFPATDLSCQVRKENGEKVAQMTITADGVVAGRFVFKVAAAQTLVWPLGDALIDIKRVSGGVTSVTDTFVTLVSKKQTA